MNLIHGISTFERDPYRPTIKSLVSELLNSGELADYAIDFVAFEGHTTVSLMSSGESGQPIRITDLN